MHSSETFLYQRCHVPSSDFTCPFSVSSSYHYLWHTKECQSQLVAFLELSLLFVPVLIAVAYLGDKVFLPMHDFNIVNALGLCHNV